MKWVEKTLSCGILLNHKYVESFLIISVKSCFQRLKKISSMKWVKNTLLWSLFNLKCGVFLVLHVQSCFQGLKMVAWNGLKHFCIGSFWILSEETCFQGLKKISSIKWVGKHSCVGSFWILSVESFESYMWSHVFRG